jgi:hypothetical protein
MTNNKKKGQQRPAVKRAPRRSKSGAYTAIVTVVAVIVAIVVFSIYRHVGAASGDVAASAAVNQVEHVPASVLNAVGAGSGVTLLPVALPAGTPANTQDGKPVVLYIGAEYCPYCAAQRWPTIVALSRFGSFANLQGMESAGGGEAFPKTQTFTFHGATYAGDLLNLQAVETNTNQPSLTGLGYTSLDKPTAAQQALLTRYDRAPYTAQAGAIPFLLIGNRFVTVGASYNPALLQGKTRDQIAAALSDTSSPIAQGVDGSANAITAAICSVTNNQPAKVCTDPAIVAWATKLGASQ